ncbi:hypothetical protein PR003_g28294 [Phytophthora rubi]|uniref:Uncharacterized protein n=1 Tax=Phytophthora rubi TaxID=129364 RepID=A0A6A4BT01_9STRA|nr:hypothetical protein PR003_g28294 [Phytophthora rubi]
MSRSKSEDATRKQRATLSLGLTWLMAKYEPE